MNDLTKDELLSILEAFHYAKGNPCWTKYHDEPLLINKIQSMIDNYHEWKIPTMADYESNEMS